MEILYYLQLFDKHKKQSTLFKNAVTWSKFNLNMMNIYKGTYFRICTNMI